MPLVEAAGFTGTSEGMTTLQFADALWLACHLAEAGTVKRFHHGDCIGADHQMALIMSNLHLVLTEPKIAKVFITCHPPSNPMKRAWFTHNDVVLPEKPYLDRNRDIVNATHYLIATPKEMAEVKRSGTWATVRYARKQGRLIYMVWPNGSITYEDYGPATPYIRQMKA